MKSEWLKVMLEEVARKRDAQERAEREADLRCREREAAGPGNGGSRHAGKSGARRQGS